MTEKRRSDEVSELRVATLRLGEQVDTLSTALATVNSLQIKQQEIERVAIEAAVAAEEQRLLSITLLSQLEEIDETAVTQQDLIRYRKRLIAKMTTLVVGVIALLCVLALGAVSYTTGRNANIYQVCMDRNSGAIALRDYIHKVATSLPPDRATELKTLEKSTVISDCGRLK